MYDRVNYIIVSDMKKTHKLILLAIAVVGLIGFFLLMNTGLKYFIPGKNPETPEEWRGYLRWACQGYSSYSACGYFACYVGGQPGLYGNLVGYVQANNTPEAEQFCPQIYQESYHFE